MANGWVMSCSIESKARLARQMREVAAAARQKIVERHHGVALRQQAVADVRADESGGAGNDDAQISSRTLYSSGACRSVHMLHSILAI